MNLEDAIRSGKPFKRTRWTSGSYLIVDGSSKLGDLIFLSNNTNYMATREDLMANDWMLDLGMYATFETKVKNFHDHGTGSLRIYLNDSDADRIMRLKKPEITLVVKGFDPVNATIVGDHEDQNKAD